MKIVKFIIESDRGLIKQVDNDGATPLHTACCQSSLKVVKFLVEAGANVNASRDNGATPLHVASHHVQPEILEFLVESGADANRVTFAGASPLYIACQKGNFKMAKVLIASGADVNIAKNNIIKETHPAILFSASVAQNQTADPPQYTAPSGRRPA